MQSFSCTNSFNSTKQQKAITDTCISCRHMLIILCFVENKLHIVLSPNSSFNKSKMHTNKLTDNLSGLFEHWLIVLIETRALWWIWLQKQINFRMVIYGKSGRKDFSIAPIGLMIIPEVMWQLILCNLAIIENEIWILPWNWKMKCSNHLL